MEKLNKELYRAIADNDELPVLDYPEKVLQFGTGVLLRALPDYFIDVANKQGKFKGRIVMVKSTPGPVSIAYSDQDNLFTHLIKGIDQGKLIEKMHINTSISRCLHAEDNWDEVLKFSISPDLQIVISNTTEVGIVFEEEAIINVLPKSFPGKLLAVLYQRYVFYKGDQQRGLIILPTELIDNNADQLLDILNRLARYNQLSNEFIEWLNQANYFCNTLVDRIVPGKLSDTLHIEAEKQIGYKDDLMIMSEPFALWAIEDKGDVIRDKLNFFDENLGCKLVDALYVYKELKLRLLNATHSFNCAYAMRLGFTYVREAIQDDDFKSYVIALMEEIRLVLNADPLINETLIDQFSNAVFDRISNPYIDHKWESISLYYSKKITVRCIPLIRKAIEMGHGRFANMQKGLEEYNHFANGELNEFLEKEVYGKE